MDEQLIDIIDFEDIDIHKFGSELSISGMIFSNAKEIYLMPFHDVNILNDAPEYINHINSEKEDWDKLMFQLDNVETIVRPKDESGKLVKIVVRKSQRRLEERIVWNVFRRDNYTCKYCGKDEVPLTVDHIIRWENMGQTVEDNLITACKKCNNKRGDMEMIDWLRCNYYLEKVPVKFIHSNLTALNKAYELPLREYKRKR